MSDQKIQWSRTGSLDDFLTGKSASIQPVLETPKTPSPGTRVAYAGGLRGSLLYADPPSDGIQGTVVTVRTAHGAATTHEGRTFVRFDDGRFLAVAGAHLRRLASQDAVKAYEVHRIAGSVGDLNDFMKTADDTLIHKATKDLWSVTKTSGGVEVSRLFDDAGKPLKMASGSEGMARAAKQFGLILGEFLF